MSIINFYDRLFSHIKINDLFPNMVKFDNEYREEEYTINLL